MLWAVGVTLVLQLLVTYLPPLQTVLGAQSLTLAQLGRVSQ
jgi:hypothetical protein